MPDIKEKLVELICDALDDGCGRHCKYMPCARVRNVIDALIANGETIQKWISVEERLPEDIGDYLVVVKSKYAWETDYRVEVDVAGYNPYEDRAYIDGCWNTFNDWDEGEEYLHITHWMPLPEPPKGE